MNDDLDIDLPSLTSYGVGIIIAALFFWVVWFPLIASMVAPDGRRVEFFLFDAAGALRPDRCRLCCHRESS